jgi:phosphoglycolate phosphatase-like HAD superfamily hydrolase
MPLPQPFPGVTEMLDELPRWALCSNKLGAYAREELERLGWEPAVALFAEAFGGRKRLDPVLEALGVKAEDVVFVGDSQHDRDCALDAGATFVLAGWNARVTPIAGDVVLARPADLLKLLEAE